MREAECDLRFFAPVLTELRQAEATLDPSQLGRAARAIASCGHLAVCGAVGLRFIAELAALWFERIGITTNAMFGHPSEIPLPAFMDRRAALLVLSMEGRNPQTLAIVDAARERGSTIISVIHAHPSPLSLKSDVTLVCAPPAANGDRVLERSRVATVQLAVAEAILEAVVDSKKRDPTEHYASGDKQTGS